MKTHGFRKEHTDKIKGGFYKTETARLSVMCICSFTWNLINQIKLLSFYEVEMENKSQKSII